MDFILPEKETVKRMIIYITQEFHVIRYDDVVVKTDISGIIDHLINWTENNQ